MERRTAGTKNKADGLPIARAYHSHRVTTH